MVLTKVCVLKENNRNMAYTQTLCAIIKKTMQMSEPNMKTYPNIAQSFGIAGILILGMIIFLPVNMLKKLIGYDAMFLIYYLLAVGLSFYIVGLIKKKKTGNNSFNFTIENKRIIPFVIVGIIFLYCGIISPINALISLTESTKVTYLDYGKLPGIFTLLQSLIAAPILEELIFRGIILDGLLKKYSPTKSILISSLIFGLIHLDRFQFVTALLMGIFIGWVYYRSRSLTLSIIIHALANLAVILMHYFINIDSIKDNILLGMYGGITNLKIAIVGSVLILVMCIYFLEKEFNKKTPEMAAQPANPDLFR